jgi:hypothetical protein
MLKDYYYDEFITVLQKTSMDNKNICRKKKFVMKLKKKDIYFNWYLNQNSLTLINDVSIQKKKIIIM